MKTIMGLFGLFIATVLFLSIEIKQRPIFGYIYNFISPATKSTQAAVEKFFGSSVDRTHHYSKKLFDNSVPKVGDSVRSKMSAVSKGKGIPEEIITKKEKQELDELIKSHK